MDRGTTRICILKAGPDCKGQPAPSRHKAANVTKPGCGWHFGCRRSTRHEGVRTIICDSENSTTRERYTIYTDLSRISKIPGLAGGMLTIDLLTLSHTADPLSASRHVRVTQFESVQNLQYHNHISIYNL